MASRWYLYPIAGTVLALGGAYAMRRAALEAMIREWLGGAPPGENYLQISIPFTVSDMAVDSARTVADSLKPRAVTPVLAPPGLDFHFQPILIATEFVEFRWQPPPYRRKLTGQPSDSAIKRLARAAYKTLYKTKVEKLRSGWKITLIGEVPL